jgi:hypothetical protein
MNAAMASRTCRDCEWHKPAGICERDFVYRAAHEPACAHFEPELADSDDDDA